MKNIMFIVGKLSNGGAERVITNLANHYNSSNCKVIVVVGKKSNMDYYLNTDIIEIKEIHNKHLWFIAILKLKHIKKKYNIKTSISFLNRSNILNCYSKVNDKVIISNRNYMSMSKQFKQNNFEKKYAQMQKKVDLIVNCSEAVTFDQINHYKIDTNKMVTIPNFVEIDDINKKMDEEIDYKYKDLFDENTIITVGRHTKHKGIYHIIRAFREVTYKNSNSKLVVLGRGDEKNLYLELIKNYKLEDRVFLLDFDSNPYKYMKNSGIFVLNSVYEGCPNVVLEAMACKLPVIASDSFGGTGEILDGKFNEKRITKLKKAKYGILIPPPNLDDYKPYLKLSANEKALKEAMLLLLNNKDLRKKYIDKSILRVEDYTKDKIIGKWNEII